MSEVTKNISSFTQQDVAYLYKNAHVKARMPGLRVLLAPAQKTFGRILVVTPRRSGDSPDRNLIRRRAKAIFYEEKLYAQGYDCLILVQREGIHLSFNELKRILLRAFLQTSTSPQNSQTTIHS